MFRKNQRKQPLPLVKEFFSESFEAFRMNRCEKQLFKTLQIVYVFECGY